MVKYSSRTLNQTFAALADPTRRQILAHLARGDRRVTDLARPHAAGIGAGDAILAAGLAAGGPDPPRAVGSALVDADDARRDRI